jgi:uncharacterized repeat protein (TIGR01451 family)
MKEKHMKKYFKSIFSLLLVCVMICSLGFAAYAADDSADSSTATPTVPYLGDGDFDKDVMDETPVTLFDNFTSAMPGDVTTQNLVVTNESSDSDYVKVYLKAKGKDNVTTNISKEEKLQETTTDHEDALAFIHQFDITLEVTKTGTSSSSNGASKAKAASTTQTVYDTTDYAWDNDYREKIHDNIYLGTIAQGEALNIAATLSLPTTVGNAASDKSAEVQWVLTLVEINGGDITVTETPSKAASKDGLFALGEVITYTVVVENTSAGEVDLTDVVVTSALYDGDEKWTVDNLPYGYSKEFTFTHTVTEEDIRRGVIKDEVNATATASLGETEEEIEANPNAKTEVYTKAVKPYLDISIKPSAPASGSIYSLGEVITYTIEVTNTGNITVKDIELVEALTGAKPDETFTLEPGEKYTFTTTYTVTQNDMNVGKIVNSATAKGTALVSSPEAEEQVYDDVSVSASCTVYTKESLLNSLFPKTGDTSNLALYCAMLGISAGALFVVFLSTKRKKHN